jgi:hypothetical protein
MANGNGEKHVFRASVVAEPVRQSPNFILIHIWLSQKALSQYALFLNQGQTRMDLSQR